MSPLFEQKYKYIVFESDDSVRSKLKSVLKTSWYDIAINLAGKVSNDNTFKLYPKFTMGVEVFGVVQGLSVITGRIEAVGANTHIDIEVRPNYTVLFAFYIILLIALLKSIGLFITSSEGDWVMVAGLFILLVFIRSLIHFSMGRLKNRFERTMSLHPEE